MTDSKEIKLTQLTDGRFDIEIEDGDIIGLDGFDTHLIISLFTDARASEAQVVRPQDRRGWPGNLVSPVDGRQLGSFLWLSEQRRLTQDTVNEYVDSAGKALSWMIEDGIAKNIDVKGEIEAPNGISLTIIITAPDGRTSTHYVPLWEVTGE